jgi:hypothetical protein
MQRLKSVRGLAALIVAVIALVAAIVGTSGANVGPTQKVLTFSFTAGPNSRTSNLFSTDGLTVNVRCGPKGGPVIFAFTSSRHADLLGHMLDGSGRTHIIKNDSFTSSSKGVSLAPNTSGDRDAAGTVVYEQASGGSASVVSVNYAFDNSRTLANLNVCTVYGTAVAS